VELNEYQVLAMKTKKALGESFDLVHSVYGLCGEVGEYADAVKKHQIYGRGFDIENAAEEIGDVMWFCALASECLGIDLNEIARANLPADDLTQFAQLLGYSVSGFGDLSYVSEHDIRVADRRVRKLLKEEG
jgi:NTP pyrophosphatase (non-canonical NTP hydrolase)